MATIVRAAVVTFLNLTARHHGYYPPAATEGGDLIPGTVDLTCFPIIWSRWKKTNQNIILGHVKGKKEKFTMGHGYQQSHDSKLKLQHS